MKKQFFKVKQLADQTVGRAEKTEVLSEDLLGVEKRVENIRHASHSFIKKISCNLTGYSLDLEKRLKKIPETHISSSLVEYSILLGENTPMGSTLKNIGEAMSYIGKDTLQYELDVDKKIFQPLNAILENYIPVINKFKKQLSKQTLEMDMCKTRYNEMLRRSYCSANDATHNASRIENLKEDYDDACNKLDFIKDAYATEMFKFLSREGDISNILLNVLEAKIEYHKSMLATLETIMHNGREYINTSWIKPAFGCPLEEYLRITNSSVSPVIEECINMLLEIGLDEVGLFRMTGSTSKIKKLKSAFDSGSIIDIHDCTRDPHVITGVLKWYLRELPEPLLSYKLYEEWCQAVKLEEDGDNLTGNKSDTKPNGQINVLTQNKESSNTNVVDLDATIDKKLTAFAKILEKLPKTNYDNLSYLMQFLALIVEHSRSNLMTSSNLATVMGPNLLWRQRDNGMDLASTNIQNSVVEFILVNCHKLFPSKIDFKPGSQTGFYSGTQDVHEAADVSTMQKNGNYKGPFNLPIKANSETRTITSNLPQWEIDSNLRNHVLTTTTDHHSKHYNHKQLHHDLNNKTKVSTSCDFNAPPLKYSTSHDSHPLIASNNTASKGNSLTKSLDQISPSPPTHSQQPNNISAPARQGISNRPLHMYISSQNKINNNDDINVGHVNQVNRNIPTSKKVVNGNNYQPMSHHSSFLVGNNGTHSTGGLALPANRPFNAHTPKKSSSHHHAVNLDGSYQSETGTSVTAVTNALSSAVENSAPNGLKEVVKNPVKCANKKKFRPPQFSRDAENKGGHNKELSTSIEPPMDRHTPKRTESLITSSPPAGELANDVKPYPELQDIPRACGSVFVLRKHARVADVMTKSLDANMIALQSTLHTNEQLNESVGSAGPVCPLADEETFDYLDYVEPCTGLTCQNEPYHSIKADTFSRRDQDTNNPDFKTNLSSNSNKENAAQIIPHQSVTVVAKIRDNGTLVGKLEEVSQENSIVQRGDPQISLDQSAPIYVKKCYKIKPSVPPPPKLHQ